MCVVAAREGGGAYIGCRLWPIRGLLMGISIGSGFSQSVQRSLYGGRGWREPGISIKDPGMART